MNHFINFINIDILILYYHRDNLWKFIDFEIMNEIISKRIIIIHYSREIQGYRVPELFSDDSKFMKKIDIWTLDYILYELVIERKMFHIDYIISRKLESLSKLNVPMSLLSKIFTSHFDECLYEMLENDSQWWFIISILRNLFESYYLILYSSISEISDDIENIFQYDIWKEWIKEDVQDYQNIFIDVINWYELNWEIEFILRLLKIFIIIP